MGEISAAPGTPIRPFFLGGGDLGFDEFLVILANLGVVFQNRHGCCAYWDENMNHPEGKIGLTDCPFYIVRDDNRIRIGCDVRVALPKDGHDRFILSKTPPPGKRWFEPPLSGLSNRFLLKINTFFILRGENPLPPRKRRQGSEKLCFFTPWKQFSRPLNPIKRRSREWQLLLRKK